MGPHDGGKIVLIEIRSLAFRYPRNGFSLGPVDLVIGENERAIMIGGNGSGKTTLLKCIAGMHLPDEGTIEMNGRDITGLPVERKAHDIALVFQDIDAMLFSDSVREELEFGPRNMKEDEGEVRAASEKMLERMGIGHLGDKHPMLLSRGEKQRVAVASVLMMKPKVLLMDEPTKGLDPDMKERMIELASVNDISLLVSSNDLEIIPMFRRVILLENGRKKFDGSSREFLERLMEFPQVRGNRYLRAQSLAVKRGWRPEEGMEKAIEVLAM